MEKLIVHSPYSGATLAELPYHSEQEAEAMFTRGHAVFSNRGQWLKPYQRKEILERFLVLLREHRNHLIQQAVLEGGKPWVDSEIEVNRAIAGVEIAISEMFHCVGRQVPMALSIGSSHRLAYTFREPLGLVFAISAFNHPVNLIIHQIIPAIAVGCAVIIKPASATPLSCLNLVQLLYQAGLPEPWCQVLICPAPLCEQFVADPRISFLSFIGSGRVGWHLRHLLAPGARCALEHGGAAPVIMAQDSDWRTALPLLVKGGYYHAGQVCVSVQRVYVHQDYFNDFCEAFVGLTRELRVGDPMEKSTDVGPLINMREVARVDEWVNEAVRLGAVCPLGGKTLGQQCYSPTVLITPSPLAKVSQEEVFGPVVALYPFQELSAAIQQANALPFSFQSAIFTQSLDTAMEAVQQLQAKTILVNDHTAFRADWMPFGGRKLSGEGVGGIPDTMQEMTFEKQFIIRSGAIN
jgi:acyl-CoA reductase-like NAD-dependent aldehyde dehydrogenase